MKESLESCCPSPYPRNDNVYNPILQARRITKVDSPLLHMIIPEMILEKKCHCLFSDLPEITRKNLYDFVNKNTLILPQLESITAFNNLDSILKVEGINFFSGGPEDIAQSMGFPGEPQHPEVLKAFSDACEKVRSSGKFMMEDIMEMISVNDLIIKEAADLLKKHGRKPNWSL